MCVKITNMYNELCENFGYKIRTNLFIECREKTFIELNKKYYDIFKPCRDILIIPQRMANTLDDEKYRYNYNIISILKELQK